MPKEKTGKQEMGKGWQGCNLGGLTSEYRPNGGEGVNSERKVLR